MLFHLDHGVTRAEIHFVSHKRYERSIGKPLAENHSHGADPPHEPIADGHSKLCSPPLAIHMDCLAIGSDHTRPVRRDFSLAGIAEGEQNAVRLCDGKEMEAPLLAGTDYFLVEEAGIEEHADSEESRHFGGDLSKDFCGELVAGLELEAQLLSPLRAAEALGYPEADGPRDYYASKAQRAEDKGVSELVALGRSEERRVGKECRL